MPLNLSSGSEYLFLAVSSAIYYGLILKYYFFQGVVGGVLLVTPNAVMFDPNVSDPLVIEHGPESYGVIAPMEFVVNAAIYYDIAHMRVRHTDNKSDCNKPEIYYAKPNEKGNGKMLRCFFKALLTSSWVFEFAVCLTLFFLLMFQRNFL